MISIHEVLFRNVWLEDIGADETRVFHITNVRCDATFVAMEGEGLARKVLAHVTVTGALVDEPQHVVATVKNGLNFEVRRGDNTGPLPVNGFEIGLGTPLAQERIATLRFTEGFQGAFRPRAAESGRFCQVIDSGDGTVRLGGLADRGTCLVADFYGVPKGIRIFVPAAVSGMGGYDSWGNCTLARISEPFSKLVPDSAVETIGGMDVRELRVENGGSCGWEVVAPLMPSAQPGSLDFPVFSSYAAEFSGGRPTCGACHVRGSFAPLTSALGPHEHIPVFFSIDRYHGIFVVLE